MRSDLVVSEQGRGMAIDAGLSAKDAVKTRAFLLCSAINTARFPLLAHIDITTAILLLLILVPIKTRIASVVGCVASVLVVLLFFLRDQNLCISIAGLLHGLLQHLGLTRDEGPNKKKG